LIASLSALFFRTKFDFFRRLPRFGTVGEPLSYSLSLRSRGKRVQRGLRVREVLRAELPGAGELYRRREPVDARRNWFDRYVGYPRWAAYMRWRRGATSEETALPDLPPGEWASVRVRLTPHRRGFIRLDGALVSRTDPLGIFRALFRCDRVESLLVLPKRYQVSWAELIGRSRDRLGGQSQAASTGGSEEFASLREYRPGDPLRHIHWKGWARLGEPVVREFHEECFVRQGLVLDTFLPGDASNDRFEEAVSVAASFAYTAPAGSGTLELLFVGAEIYQVSSGQGPAASDRLLEALACVQATPDQSFARLTEAVLQRAHELSGCVCVLLSWDEERRRLVRMLRALDIPLLVLVIAESEDDAALDPGPMADCAERFKKLRGGRIEFDLARHGGVVSADFAPGETAS
ncbi:MAG: DUF58 domain-containing protein, partial [Gammaproteobacteria bacterium]|nr:DUF58 domain-containing protein [Gammaproteobacteria bacterium]